MDVVIAGAGPAGWIAAEVARGEGLEVHLVDPDPERPWSPTYCAWVDEVPSDRRLFRKVWDAVDLWLSDTCRTLDRPYGCFDNRRLQQACVEAAGGVHLHCCSVEAVRREGSRISVIAGREELRADLLVDCTGVGRFVRRPRAALAYQTALGVWGEAATDREPRPVFMDFRPSHQVEAAPTFGYVLPLEPGRILVEETVLAASRPVDPELLREGMCARARMHRVRIPPASEEERVFIGMGGDYPTGRQPVAGFGAAASMVHPATGYLVGHLLRRRDALRAGLREAARRDRPEARTESVHRALFGPALRGTRTLHNLGLEVLLGLDRAGIQRFFDAFFAAPEGHWRGYLSVDTRPADIMRAMWTCFLGLPARDRWRVLERIGGAMTFGGTSF